MLIWSDSTRAHGCFAAQLLCAAMLAIVLTGCQTPWPCNKRHIVAEDLQARTGSSLGAGGGIQSGQLPAGIAVDDGVTADEAVAAALWNNAALHEALSQLGVSTAQLFDAGLLTDPQFVVFFPLGPKQLEFTTFQAIDALWLRPIRVRAAELNLCQLSQTMVQNGLDVARDVRRAHADLLLAQQRAELTDEALELRKQIFALANKRLEAGDISELEATTSEIDTLQSKAAAAGATHDVVLAQNRLRTLMGVQFPAEQLNAVNGHDHDKPTATVDQLVGAAFAIRPDLRAAEIAVNAANERVELAKNQFMTLDAIFDVNGSGDSGVEAGGGLRFSLPFFNGNKGGIAIAEAQVEQANRQFATLRDQIELEVRTAYTQLEQAAQQRSMIDGQMLPTLDTAGELARRNYVDGGVPYFLVLQTTGQYVDAKLRRIAANADVHRAIAELERSVGQRLVFNSDKESEEVTDVPPTPEQEDGKEDEKEEDEESVPGPELIDSPDEAASP